MDTWTRRQLQGSVQVAHASSASSGSEIQASNAPLTGTRSGDAVGLHIGGLVGQTWLGTLRGDELVLQLPQRDQTLRSVAFSRADPAAYDSALERVREQVRTGRLAAAEQQRQLVEQRAQQEREEAERKAAAQQQAAQEDAADRGRSALAVLDDSERALTRGQDKLSGRLAALKETVTGHAAAVTGAGRAKGCTAQGEALNKAGEAYSTFGVAVGELYDTASQVGEAADEVEAEVGDLRQAGDDLREAGGTVPTTWSARAQRAAERVKEARTAAARAEKTAGDLEEQVDRLDQNTADLIC